MKISYFFFIILEIKESFHKIDLNGDGRLSRRELMKAAAVLGMNPTDKDIDAMMKDVDKNSTWKLQLFSMGLGLWLKCYTVVGSLLSSIFGFGPTVNPIGYKISQIN